MLAPRADVPRCAVQSTAGTARPVQSPPADRQRRPTRECSCTDQAMNRTRLAAKASCPMAPTPLDVSTHATRPAPGPAPPSTHPCRHMCVACGMSARSRGVPTATRTPRGSTATGRVLTKDTAAAAKGDAVLSVAQCANVCREVGKHQRRHCAARASSWEHGAHTPRRKSVSSACVTQSLPAGSVGKLANAPARIKPAAHREDTPRNRSNGFLRSACC